MKKRLLSLLTLLLAFCTYTQAQDFSALESLNFKSKEDYKLYEPQVQECASYILAKPADDNDPNRQIALQMLVKWMTGTPDYTFEVDGTFAKLMEKNEALLGLYFASMTKFVLENNDKATDKNEVKYNSYMLLLSYCENSENKVKQTKELKKAIAAKNKGELKAYLKI